MQTQARRSSAETRETHRKQRVIPGVRVVLQQDNGLQRRIVAGMLVLRAGDILRGDRLRPIAAFLGWLIEQPDGEELAQRTLQRRIDFRLRSQPLLHRVRQRRKSVPVVHVGAVVDGHGGGVRCRARVNWRALEVQDSTRVCDDDGVRTLPSIAHYLIQEPAVGTGWSPILAIVCGKLSAQYVTKKA